MKPLPTGNPKVSVPPVDCCVNWLDVADFAAEQVRAAGDVAIEEERLGERQRVVLRALAALQRHGQALAAAEEVGGLERQLAEEAFELRDAGAEGELVAVLLFELHLHVDLVVDVGRLVDVDVLAGPLERLEVPELVQALDAVLQRLGVEDAVLVQPQFAPNHVVARRRVAGEDDAVDEVLLAFLDLQRDVDRGRAFGLRVERPRAPRAPGARPGSARR